MTKEKKQSFTFRVSNANKTEMIAILYDIAIEYINEAYVSADSGDTVGFRDNVNRIRSTVRELMASLNTQTELGRTFLSLYIFCNEQLTKAYLDIDKKPLETVFKMFTTLSGAYKEAGLKDASGPVMKNTESVFSGLTYNKSLSLDSISTGASNRGFLA